MSAIGILGGMGPQASSHLLHLIVRDTHKYVSVSSDSDFPEIVLLSTPVPNFISSKRNLEKAKTILIERTKQLEIAGCTVNAIACNTAHLLLPEFQAVTSVPFLSIPQLVAKTANQRGFSRVGLLATPNTLSSRLYDDALDSETALFRPNVETAKHVERLIIRQLQGRTVHLDTLELRALVDRFMREEHLDSVVLGCTELPIIFGVVRDPRVIDTLEVLSEGLLENFFASSKTNGAIL